MLHNNYRLDWVLNLICCWKLLLLLLYVCGAKGLSASAARQFNVKFWYSFQTAPHITSPFLVWWGAKHFPVSRASCHHFHTVKWLVKMAKNTYFRLLHSHMIVGIIIQGVPQLSSHFVLLVFSASRAHTEVHFTIFQQPRRRRFQNSPYFPPYVKNWSSYRAKCEANWI